MFHEALELKGAGEVFRTFICVLLVVEIEHVRDRLRRAVDIDDFELGCWRRIYDDSDETTIQQEAVGSVASGDGGDVNILVTVCSVIGAEQGIFALREEEAEPDLVGRERPALRGLVTRGATAPVGSQGLEEGPLMSMGAPLALSVASSPLAFGNGVRLGSF